MFKKIIGAFLYLSVYLLLPLFLTSRTKLPSSAVYLFYSVSTLFLIYFYRKLRVKKRHFVFRQQGIEEEINILENEISRRTAIRDSLLEKIQRYHNLKDILVALNQNLELDYIAEKILSICFPLLGKNKGTALLYLTDKKEKNRLSLFKSQKENGSLVIKAKAGDIFDLWVLRHSTPLLVDDAKRDFRFDLEKLARSSSRPILSVISVPLISEESFLGILRADNPEAKFYTQDDLRLLATISDLAAVALENGRLFQATQELAIRDGLTSFYRKEYFLERLEEECKRGLRQDEIFSLLMLDIDFFKDYNDRFGHTAGDIVLRTLSRLISDTLREGHPIIGRFGGEEFCIILPSVNKHKAYLVADELRTAIKNLKISLRRKETSVTVSIGVAVFPQDAGDALQLVKKCDNAMYKAKHSGRNKVENA